MCSVTNISQQQEAYSRHLRQRQKDMLFLKQLDLSIEEVEKTKSRLEEMRRELVNRLGLNKPDGPEAA